MIGSIAIALLYVILLGTLHNIDSDFVPKKNYNIVLFGVINNSDDVIDRINDHN